MAEKVEEKGETMVNIWNDLVSPAEMSFIFVLCMTL